MKLNITERIIASIIYFLIILSIGFYLDGGWDFLTDSTNHLNTLFVASSLMLIMGAYITEPYFTKPVDIIAKTFAILLVLFGISETSKFLFYDLFLYFNLVLLLASIVLIFIQQLNKLNKLQYAIYIVVTQLAKPEVIFSILYLLTLFSFYSRSPINELIMLFGLWLVLIFKKPVEILSKLIVKLFFSLFRTRIEDINPVGQAIGCENPYLYTVEVNYDNKQKQMLAKDDLVSITSENGLQSVGIVINQKHLVDRSWFSVYLLQDDKGNIISIQPKNSIDKNSIFYSPNQVFKMDIDNLDSKDIEKIEKSYLYHNKSKIIGYVSKNSNINNIKFNLLLDEQNKEHQEIGEGSILVSKIFSQETLYQIIDGITSEESLEAHNKYGYTTVIAKKIGRYDTENRELVTVKWLPSIYSPVFLLEDKKDIDHDYNSFIGKLPNTSYEIPIKDYDSLVTHNTAILGILGIGKSRLTFELIKKVIENTDTKVICIDITNQYRDMEEGLPIYLEPSTIVSDEESIFNSINTKFDYIHTENGKQNPDRSGNIGEYRKELRKDICQFLFDEERIPEDKKIKQAKKVRIFNPDYHKVSKGEKIGYNVVTSALTQAEKTRIISEELFKILMKLPLTNNQKLKVLLVFEEAHSLIPEWNSTANPGDQSASNGTAKIILQGRKYGLGSFVVTQRTANISKSILNQCNTIFALRIFDDTGKQFLENYIGSDYANVLPTLEERHCIAVGKALKLKQPIILRLNDMENIIKSNDDGEINGNIHKTNRLQK
jgi:hypothetical protein